MPIGKNFFKGLDEYMANKVMLVSNSCTSRWLKVQELLDVSTIYNVRTEKFRSELVFKSGVLKIGDKITILRRVDGNSFDIQCTIKEICKNLIVYLNHGLYDYGCFTPADVFKGKVEIYFSGE